MFMKAPLTTLQVGSGITLYVANLLGIYPSHKVLFHPCLALAPMWQTYRMATGFLVLGSSPYDILQRSIGLIVWQAPLEMAFKAASTPITLPGSFQKEAETSQQQGSLVQRGMSSLHRLVKYAQTNKFLHAQMIAAVTIVAMEYLLYRYPNENSEFISVFPYSLYPSLEFSMRWLWAATETASSVPLFGILPIQPIYTPIISCALGGFRDTIAMIKGLFSAFMVGFIMDLRRSDGQPVVIWLQDIGKQWLLFGQKIFKRIQRYVMGSPKSKRKPSKGKKHESEPEKDDLEDLDEPLFSNIPSALATAAFGTLVKVAANANMTPPPGAGPSSGPSLKIGS